MTLVLKRFSYIGDGLSHVAFGALAIGTIFDLTSTSVVVMPTKQFKTNITIFAATIVEPTGVENRIESTIPRSAQTTEILFIFDIILPYLC